MFVTRPPKIDLKLHFEGAGMNFNPFGRAQGQTIIKLIPEIAATDFFLHFKLLEGHENDF